MVVCGLPPAGLAGVHSGGAVPGAIHPESSESQAKRAACRLTTACSCRRFAPRLMIGVRPYDEMSLQNCSFFPLEQVTHAGDSESPSIFSQRPQATLHVHGSCPSDSVPWSARSPLFGDHAVDH